MGQADIQGIFGHLMTLSTLQDSVDIYRCINILRVQSVCRESYVYGIFILYVYFMYMYIYMHIYGLTWFDIQAIRLLYIDTVYVHIYIHAQIFFDIKRLF